jgi:hypothetical protein
MRRLPPSTCSSSNPPFIQGQSHTWQLPGTEPAWEGHISPGATADVGWVWPCAQQDSQSSEITKLQSKTKRGLLGFWKPALQKPRRKPPASGRGLPSNRGIWINCICNDDHTNCSQFNTPVASPISLRFQEQAVAVTSKTNVAPVETLCAAALDAAG